MLLSYHFLVCINERNNLKLLLEILYSFVDSFSFGVIFNIKGRKVFFAGLGGALSQACYGFLAIYLSNEIPAYLFATIITAIYAEIMARISKTPATVFLVPSIIPLVPGGMIYNTMEYCLMGENIMFFNKLIETIGVAGALAMGILIVSSINKVIRVGLAKYSVGKIKNKTPTL